ncbi:DUF4387 family protein [Mesobacterium sp. TK19101]|uniref:DUF4387 family protein n=1 Tax=Mesobacterium hydrothermale TaxID=3111907 RepID=A0ABU6HG29_9RHOB|nr:DUF4387 family protein [Mesobacterium sp. TK19101]MEC3860694.1 DUF4387 family protein [Mesobacterium sp. TK19101]
MTTLGEKVVKVRSKNAGPFWVTVDIFCGDADRFAEVRQAITSDRVADLYKVPLDSLKRFDIAELSVIKFSFPRPVPQASPRDRDQHGAQYAVLLEELPLG